MSLEQFKDDLSLKEKYLSFDKETRIRRMQFFERMLIPTLLLWLLLIVPAVIVSIMFSTENSDKILFFITLIIVLIEFLIYIKVYPKIIQKRAHDFGKKGINESYIFIGALIISELLTLYTMYLGIFTDVIIIPEIYNNIDKILSSITGILWIYLLWNPGTKGKNEYGEQKYYKVKFLG